MAKKKLRSAAVIHLGSENITMQLIEYTGLDDIRIITELRSKVRLGEETFQTRKISFGTMLQIVEILKGYRQVMREYGVKSYILQATTAVREAENQQYFLDQVLVKTGFQIEVVNMSREIYTKMASLLRTMETHGKMPLPREGVLLADISSGGLGLTYVKDREVKFQQNLHVGLVRLKKQFTRNERSSIHFEQALKEYLQDRIGVVAEELENETISMLVLTGTESQVLLDLFGKKRTRKENVSFTADEVKAFYHRVYHLKESQLEKLFSLTPEETEVALPAITLCQLLMEMSRAQQILMPVDRFVDGMKILYIARQLDQQFLEEMLDIQMSLVRNIGNRFHYDAPHAAWVENMCCVLFDALAPSQGLDQEDKILLRAAAYLHNIGKYASMRTYDRYNYYLIDSADLLGFSVEQCHTIAQISYLYTLDRPELEGSEPKDFGSGIPPLVAKLAGILRLADSLDISGRQKIRDCKVVIRGNELRVRAKSRENLSLEEWTFSKRGSFFEEVFGLRPVLEKAEEK